MGWIAVATQHVAVEITSCRQAPSEHACFDHWVQQLAPRMPTLSVKVRECSCAFQWPDVRLVFFEGAAHLFTCLPDQAACADSQGSQRSDEEQEQRPQQAKKVGRPAQASKLGTSTRAHQPSATPEVEDDYVDAGAVDRASDADASQLSDGEQHGDHDVEVQQFDMPVMEEAAKETVSAMASRRSKAGVKGSSVAAVHADVVRSRGMCTVLVLAGGRQSSSCTHHPSPPCSPQKAPRPFLLTAKCCTFHASTACPVPRSIQPQVRALGLLACWWASHSPGVLLFTILL